ncbi:alpha/beta fold hydrolase [Xanthomarina spongicola]|uniref:Pimeloyl-ACP methyl ester carboxylesterase n=1 Tax=Xanthomarina spongicola TaxID=570520 RepID=A0A316DU36_9FLAO|nr:alpha/beta fold hydrolase [Xanthomarina spongicola]PWK20932.1 pimeloyl-ACP methyl ester carboxylesterase [Xanthomarina spongicola]
MQLYSDIIGQGKPFIILHGFLGMSDNWNTLGKKFSEEGYQVHLLDQRNHGRSFHDNVFNYEVLVEDLNAYCQEHQLKDIILLGHSMGGKVAMLFAATHPELVSKLLVADISPRFYPVHHELILKGLSSLDFNKIKSRGDADDQLAHFITNFGIRQFLLKNLYWNDSKELALRINLKVLKDNIEEIGEALPMHTQYFGKTLFLRGDRSEYIGLQDEAIINTHFPNAKIVTISKSGHWLHAENPKDFFKEVINFLG